MTCAGSKISDAPEKNILQLLSYIWDRERLREGGGEQGRAWITGRRAGVCSLEAGTPVQRCYIRLSEAR